MKIVGIVLLIVIIALCSYGLGNAAGMDYVCDEILDLIRTRRKSKAPHDILADIMRRINEIKLKGD